MYDYAYVNMHHFYGRESTKLRQYVLKLDLTYKKNVLHIKAVVKDVPKRL